MLSQDYLNSRFTYKHGILLWKTHYNVTNIGKRAGNLTKEGYIRISINNKRYLAHRIIYVMIKGEIPNGYEIDHINRIKNDNRISNLRIVTRGENNRNKIKYKNNTSGYKGVFFISRNSKWRARIRKDGVTINLGTFDSAKIAAKVYIMAALRFFGEYANKTRNI